MQPGEQNFRNYKKASVTIKFGSIPYSKAKCLIYEAKKLFLVEYKTSFITKSTETSIRGPLTRLKHEEFPNVV